MPDDMQLIFSPDFFEEWEGTQEELDEEIARLKEMLQSMPIDELLEMSEEITEEEFNAMIEGTRKTLQ